MSQDFNNMANIANLDWRNTDSVLHRDEHMAPIKIKIKQDNTQRSSLDSDTKDKTQSNN